MHSRTVFFIVLIVIERSILMRKTPIAVGDLSYEDEDTLTPTIIPIFDESDKVSLVAPLRQAKAEGKAPAEVVAADELREVRVSLDLGLAKAGVDMAKTKLEKRRSRGRGAGPGGGHGQPAFHPDGGRSTQNQVRENLMLAEVAIEAGDTADAKAALAEAGRELDAYAKDTGEADKKAIARLRDEMKALEGKLEKGEKGKGFTTTIESWWDRIGKLMR
jgi:hypothetical protein